MDFDFNINALFNDPISMITGKPNFPQVHDRQQLLKQLEHVINTIGIKSARAQSLSAPITSWTKLQINSHKIYILKEPLSNNALGSVLGFIKIGRKQLFVLDREGNHNELSPLCVLDFYIHESQQRKGFGLRLFKFMLQDAAVKPSHLAIDRPSTKLMAFLRKHFNLWATIPQVNNFVVFDAFFKNRTDMKRSNNRRYGHHQDERFTEFRPVSRAVSDDYIKRNREVSHGTDQRDNRPVSGTVIGRNTKYSIFGDMFMNNMQYSQSHTNSYGNGLGARSNMYSRFSVKENNNVTSIPSSRKAVRRTTDDEIVTNPYRRVTNKHSKHTNSETEVSENGDNNLQNADKSDDHESTLSYENPAELKIRSQDEKEMQNKDLNVIEDPVHPRKQIGNRIPENRYKNPADMLLELQKKDQRSLQNNNRRFARSRNSNLFGSSINLFGVPAKSHFHHKFD